MQVSLTKTGWMCSLRPWVSALEPLLTYRRREGDFAPGRQRKRATYVTERIFEVSGDVGAFPAGMLPRVVRRLKELGYMVDVSGTVHEFPVPDFNAVEQLRPGQEELLLSVAAHEGGLLVGGTGTGKCLAPGTKVLLYSGELEKVENLQITKGV